MFFIMAMYESDLHTNSVKSLILLLHSLGTFVIFLCLRKNVIFVCSYVYRSELGPIWITALTYLGSLCA